MGKLPWNKAWELIFIMSIKKREAQKFPLKVRVLGRQPCCG
jgi:hypothetical protein